MAELNVPETSIVIRTLNEERWLPEVFAALDRQTYRDFEVLVVDSGSVDRTREIAAANGARITRLRSEDFTFGHALNVGIREARGDFIAIISAHAIPADEHWLERLLSPLREDDVAMVTGGQIGHEVSKFSEARDFERVFPSRDVVMDEDRPLANNANSAIKRELWQQYPFDEGLPGLEDIGWAKHWINRNRRIVYESTAAIVHVHTETWPQVRRRYYREGIAARWVRVKILRHIPGEILREVAWCLHDLWLATTRRKLPSLAAQIMRFRYEKLVGTVQGILDSRWFSNPARRAEIFFDQRFPAVVVHGPQKARIEERRVPSLRPGEVLVRVSFVGICGTDLEIFEGSLGYYRSGLAKYPIVPGHEMSGTVVVVGPRVTGLSEGTRVVVECIQGCGECAACARDEAIRCAERREVGVIGQDGGYAEYVVTRARYVHAVPDGVSQAQAALAEPLAVVIKGLRRLGSQAAGDLPRTCAVVGAGTIGHLAARVLSLRGHTVTVFDRERARLAMLGDGIAREQTLRELDRFDWIVEATGDQGILDTLLGGAATGATLLLLGLPYSHQSLSFESIVTFDRSIIGSVGSNAADFREALRTLPMIDASVFLGTRFPLTGFEEAWEKFRSKSALKVMLQPDPGAA
jgi:2-desacetyl-2-hydroxyethyl bacteriochlorophyllide A dehydrogenase